MSAWTSAILYRPGPPPVIMPVSLADFIEKLVALDILQESPRLHAELKFGKSIDQDMKEITYLENPEATVTAIKHMPMDAEINNTTIAEMLHWLRSPFKKKGLFTRQLIDPIIYRSYIDLGELKENVRKDFMREEDPENNIGSFWLSSFSFNIAPETVADPQGDGTRYMVGWISISISGQCYLWPWKYEEVLALIKANEGMQQILELCKSTWPLPPVEPTQVLIEMRKSMGHLWGGTDYDAPPDWRWTINESY